MDVLVPQIVEESVQHRALEQFVDVLVPQIVEERVPIRTPEQIVDVPVPPVLEAVVEVSAPPECVQNRTPEPVVDVPVPQFKEDSLQLGPQKRVQNRTLEQIVDEPVPPVAEQLVEEPVPLERIPVPSQRELHEAFLGFYGQEEADEAEYDDEEEFSRFPPHWRPRRWCPFVVEGACCLYGNRCAFAHHESEFLCAPAGPRGR